MSVEVNKGENPFPDNNVPLIKMLEEGFGAQAVSLKGLEDKFNA